MSPKTCEEGMEEMFWVPFKPTTAPQCPMMYSLRNHSSLIGCFSRKHERKNETAFEIEGNLPHRGSITTSRHQSPTTRDSRSQPPIPKEQPQAMNEAANRERLTEGKASVWDIKISSLEQKLNLNIRRSILWGRIKREFKNRGKCIIKDLTGVFPLGVSKWVVFLYEWAR